MFEKAVRDGVRCEKVPRKELDEPSMLDAYETHDEMGCGRGGGCGVVVAAPLALASSLGALALPRDASA